MATRQYIGARYTTKVYENTVTPGSAEWQASVTYEPLTLVTYNNSSYLSKKTVPASVGNPASNPAYWVVTGNYNGQISVLDGRIGDLEQEVNDEETRVNTIFKRRFLFVGDSYGDNPAVPTTWGAQCAGALGLDASQWDNLCKSGAQWSHATNYYQKQIENYTGDRDTITDIVICGGVNDIGTSQGTIVSKMIDFRNYARSEFPFAKIWLGWVGFGTTVMGNSSTYDTYNAFKCCGYAGIAEIPCILSANHNYNNLVDGAYHPDATAVRRIGWALASILQGGTYTGCDYTAASPLMPKNNLLQSTATLTIGSQACHEYFEGENIKINCKRVVGTFASPVTIPQDNDLLVGYINDTYFRPQDDTLGFNGSLAGYDNNNVWIAADGYFYTLYTGGKTELRFHSLSAPIPNVSAIAFNCEIEYPLIMC